jgi:hypothetical protein
MVSFCSRILSDVKFGSGGDTSKYNVNDVRCVSLLGKSHASDTHLFQQTIILEIAVSELLWTSTRINISQLPRLNDR